MRPHLNGPPESWSPGKPATRVLALLLDQRPHTVEEFWDYLCESIKPQMAVRAAISQSGDHNSKERIKEQAATNPAAVIEEGNRIKLGSTLKHLQRRGFITREITRYLDRGALGTTQAEDTRSAIIQITPEGLHYVLNDASARTKVWKEILIGLARKRLGITLVYLGKPRLQEIGGSNNDYQSEKGAI